MQDPVRLILVSVLAVATLAASSLSFAVKESRLWLPRAQQELRPLLLAAAQLAENSDECEEVVSGELDADPSADADPVFRIVCRNPAGYTYSVRVVDAGKPGAKLEKVQSGVPASGKVTSSAQSPSVTGEGAAKKCMAAVQLRTSGMAGAKLDEAALRPLSSATAGELLYGLDFDATDPSGNVLRFQAICRVAAGGNAGVEIKPRRTALVKPAAKEAATSTEAATSSGTEAAGVVPADGAPETKTTPISLPERGNSTGADNRDADDAGKVKPAADDGWEVIE